MKKLLYSLIVIITSVAFVVSCADESLDPLPTNTAIKGTILALRGDQLDAVYWNGEAYGASFMADNIKGTETFDFKGEFLSGDLTSLASIDVNVIKKTKVDKTVTTEKVLLANIPFSAFKNDGTYAGPYVEVSIPLSDILTKVGYTGDKALELLDSSNVYGFNFDIATDLNLTDGTKVVAGQLIASGLYQSDQFYPAQQLKYGITTQESFRPTVSISSKKGLPLANLSSDTVFVKFSEAVSAPTSVTYSPTNAGTLSELKGYPVKGKGPNGKDFYAIFTAGSAYTGNVSIKVSGAIATSTGLEQNPKTGTIKTDNIVPQIISFSTDARVGRGGSIDIILESNEKLGAAPQLVFDIGTTAVNEIGTVDMVLSADGLSASYTYDMKDDDKNAVHGIITVKAIEIMDVAENAAADVETEFTVDLATPPAPVIVLSSPYDYGTQIKWTITETRDDGDPLIVGDGANENGSESGTIYFLVQSATATTPPTGFTPGDEATFTVGTAKVSPTGAVAISGGSTDEIFTPFAANGTGLKVYAVFVSNTGNVSAVSAVTVVDMLN